MEPDRQGGEREGRQRADAAVGEGRRRRQQQAVMSRSQHEQPMNATDTKKVV